MKRVCAVLGVLLTTGFTRVSPAEEAGATPNLERELEITQKVLVSPRLQAAFDYLERAEDETVQEWLSLCNAYAPSSREMPRSRLIYKLFQIYGLDSVHIDDASNVIGVRRGVGDGPTVVLNAHQDNIPLWPEGQPIEAFVADGRVWCPAAADDLMGITQMLTVLRALNAADIETQGDIWFVGLTGEEAPTGPQHQDASPGAKQFVRANVPHNIDWRRGDILVQFHGNGGGGVSTGSSPVRNRTQLRVFAPFDGNRWAPHAVDALGRIITRVGTEVRDPRASGSDEAASRDLPAEILYMNMGMVKAGDVISSPTSEAWIRFDMRSAKEARLLQAHEQIRAIADQVLSEMGEDFSYVYEINSKNGTETGIEGWDPADNAPARMAAAAARVLYETEPVIDPTNGCGDCVRAYREGMPAMSLRGGIVDYLGGRFERQGRGSLQSETRRKSVGHSVTESGEIVRLWSGIKHGLLFTVSYTGLAN
jgi:acetylornithine deacetylase/succinyl-diaminopimelate desuccinylase-like protein